MVVHTHKPTMQWVEAGGLWVWGQSGLHSKNQSQNPKRKKKEERFISCPWLASSIALRTLARQGIIVGVIWWNKTAHFKVARKQKENGRCQDPKVPFKGTTFNNLTSFNSAPPPNDSITSQ
jgi:hypothetical protein